MKSKVITVILVSMLCLGIGFGMGNFVQNGGFGFLLEDKPNEEDVGREMTTNDFVVNVREKADTNANVIATLPTDSIVTFVSSQDGWTKITTADGITGFVASSFVSFVDGNKTEDNNDKPANNDTGDSSGADNKDVANNTASSNTTNTLSTIVKPSGEFVNVRKGMGVDTEKVGVLNSGQTAKYLGEKDGWYNIKLSDGKVGWVLATLAVKSQVNTAATVSGATTTKKVVITNEYANIRKAASIDSEKLVKLLKDKEVQYIAKEGDWFKIKLDDGQVGYVKSNLAQIK